MNRRKLLTDRVLPRRRDWDYAWQYDGAAPMRDILLWCEHNIPLASYMYNGFETIYFDDPRYYSWFLLKWQ